MEKECKRNIEVIWLLKCLKPDHKYREIEKQLKESGESQISTSDPESRQIVFRERSIYAENYERNRKNTKEKEQLYRRRQAIVEHPFGNIKRQWGFSYILKFTLLAYPENKVRQESFSDTLYFKTKR